MGTRSDFLGDLVVSTYLGTLSRLDYSGVTEASGPATINDPVPYLGGRVVSFSTASYDEKRTIFEGLRADGKLQGFVNQLAAIGARFTNGYGFFSTVETPTRDDSGLIEWAGIVASFVPFVGQGVGLLGTAAAASGGDSAAILGAAESQTFTAGATGSGIAGSVEVGLGASVTDLGGGLTVDAFGNVTGGALELGGAIPASVQAAIDFGAAGGAATSLIQGGAKLLTQAATSVASSALVKGIAGALLAPTKTAQAPSPAPAMVDQGGAFNQLLLLAAAVAAAAVAGS